VPPPVCTKVSHEECALFWHIAPSADNKAALFTRVRGRGMLGSPDSESCIDPPLRATRMASKALHAAWRKSPHILWWIDLQRDEGSRPGLMCVDRAVLVGMRHPGLGPRLHRRHALCGLCVSRRGFSPSVCGRRTLAELHIQDIGPRMLPSFAALGQGACCRRPCCSFPFLALFAHIVPSIAPALASIAVSCVRLTSRSARCLHIINVPKLHTL
jgi:hypothetical protein